MIYSWHPTGLIRQALKLNGEVIDILVENVLQLARVNRKIFNVKRHNRRVEQVAVVDKNEWDGIDCSKLA